MADPSLALTRTFLHNPLGRIDLEDRIEPGIGRIYTTPDGAEYESVTTVLKNVPDDDPEWKEKWIARVGEDEATRVTGRALTRGTNLHRMAEKYLLGDSSYYAGEMPVNVKSFRELRKVIDDGVGTVYGVEFPLFSHRLKTAGRSDLVCGYRGYNSVMDWKTASRPKTKAMIRKYFIQGACYAVMIEEAYGINIPQVVVPLMVEHEEVQVHVEKTDDWRELVEKIYFRRMYS